MSRKKKPLNPPPTPVNIRSRDYSVLVASGLNELEACFGRCNTTLHAIEIDSDVFNGQNTADTITHEILHAMIFEAGLQQVKKWDEETVVSLLSPVLTCFLSDNPDMVKYIVNMHKRGKKDVS